MGHLMRKLASSFVACIVLMCMFSVAFENVVGFSVLWPIAFFGLAALAALGVDAAMTSRSDDWRYENRLVRRPST